MILVWGEKNAYDSDQKNAHPRARIRWSFFELPGRRLCRLDLRLSASRASYIDFDILSGYITRTAIYILGHFPLFSFIGYSSNRLPTFLRLSSFSAPITGNGLFYPSTYVRAHGSVSETTTRSLEYRRYRRRYHLPLASRGRWWERTRRRHSQGCKVALCHPYGG